jgi:L-proline amide hydrolase
LLHAKIKVKRGDASFNLDYEITNAELTKAPLVVLHGGPGLPRDYLLPLQDIITDRPILFHDQLGSGKSDAPEDKSYYSIDGSVDDLVALLDEVKFDKFHLYGQSYGGILAFEYLKKAQPTNCLSVTLSSAPSSIPRMHAEWDRLLEYISETTPQFLVEEAFRRVHVCRTTVPPKILQQSYENASTVWDGVDMIPDYEISVSKKIESPPALATRGEYDFVTEECLSAWQECFSNIETDELFDCSHHGLLEKPLVYGEMLNAFLAKHDNYNCA